MATKRFKNRLTTDLIPLADAKIHCVVEHNDDDAKIQALIYAAIAHTENVTRTTLPLTEYAVTAANPGALAIRIAAPPPRMVSAVTYWDGSARQTLPTSDYTVVLDGDELVVSPLTFFPVIAEYIQFDMIAGYGSISGGVAGYGAAYPPEYGSGELIPDLVLPYELILGCHMLIAGWYANRETIIVGTIISKVPLGYESLVMKHRNYKT
jgi:uncharacterized phiE125 gp8 family phage protein